MTNSKTFCLLLLLAGFFINCSTTYDKTLPVPMTPISLPPSAKVNEETKKFESTGGKFTIGISQFPLETRDLGTETANKKGIDVGKIFIWKFEKTLYTVLYKKTLDSDGNPLEPDGELKSQHERDLEALIIGMRRGIVKNNAKLISEKPFKFSKYPGTEFRYVSADGTKFIGRVYMINTIGYQVVGGYGDDEFEKEVSEVLDSFNLLPDKM